MLRVLLIIALIFAPPESTEARPPSTPAPLSHASATPTEPTKPLSQQLGAFQQREFEALSEWIRQRFCEVSGMSPDKVEVRVSENHLAAIDTTTRRKSSGVVIHYNPFLIEQYVKSDNALNSILRHEYGHEVLDATQMQRAATAMQAREAAKKNPVLSTEEAIAAVTREFSVPMEHYCDIYATLHGLRAGESQQPFMELFKTLPGNREYFSHTHPAGLDRAHTIEVTTEWAKRHKEWMPKGPETLTTVGYQRIGELSKYISQYYANYHRWANSPEMDTEVRRQIDEAKKKVVDTFWKNFDTEIHRRVKTRLSHEPRSGAIGLPEIKNTTFTSTQSEYLKEVNRQAKQEIKAQFVEMLKRSVSRHLPKGAKTPNEAIIQTVQAKDVLYSLLKDSVTAIPGFDPQKIQEEVKNLFVQRNQRQLQALLANADVPKLFQTAPEHAVLTIAQGLPAHQVFQNLHHLSKLFTPNTIGAVVQHKARSFNEWARVAKKDARVLIDALNSAGHLYLVQDMSPWNAKKAETVRGLVQHHRSAIREWVKENSYATKRIEHNAADFAAFGAEPHLFLEPSEMAKVLDIKALAVIVTDPKMTSSKDPYLEALRTQEAKHLAALQGREPATSVGRLDAIQNAKDFIRATAADPSLSSRLQGGLKLSYEKELKKWAELPSDEFLKLWRLTLNRLSNSYRRDHESIEDVLVALVLRSDEEKKADALFKTYPEAKIPAVLKRRIREERLAMIEISMSYWDGSPTLRRLALRNLSLDERKILAAKILNKDNSLAYHVHWLLEGDQTAELFRSLAVPAAEKIRHVKKLGLSPQGEERLVTTLGEDLLQEALRDDRSLRAFSQSAYQSLKESHEDHTKLFKDYWDHRRQAVSADTFVRDIKDMIACYQGQFCHEITFEQARPYLSHLSLEERVALLRNKRDWPELEQDKLITEILQNSSFDYDRRLDIAQRASGSLSQSERIWEELVLPDLHQRGYDPDRAAAALKAVFKEHPETQYAKVDSVANAFQLSVRQIETLEDTVFPDTEKGGLYKMIQGFRSTLLGSGLSYEDGKSSAKVTRHRILALRYLLGLETSPHWDFLPELDRLPSLARESLILDLISPHDPMGLWHPDNTKGRAAILATLLEGIPKSSEGYAKLVLNAYLKALDRLPSAPRAHLFLARALGAIRHSQKKAETTKSGSPLIQVVRRIVDAKGGLWAKITQMISGDPSIVPDRTDRMSLQKANDQVDVPARKRALKYLEKALGSEIEEVVEVKTPPLGSGSMNVTLEVKLRNGQSYAARMVRDDPDLEAQFERGDLKATVHEIRQSLAKHEYAVDPVSVNRMADGIEEATELLADSMQAEANLQHDREVLRTLGAESETSRAVYDGFERDLKVRSMAVREAKVLNYSEGGANPIRILLTPIARDIRNQSPRPTQKELVRAYQAMYRAEIRALFEKGLADADGHKGNWLITRDRFNPKILLVHRIDLAQPVRLDPKELDDLRGVFAGITRRMDPGLVGIPRIEDGDMAKAFLGLVRTSNEGHSQEALTKSVLPALQKAFKGRRATNAPEFLDEWRVALQEISGKKVEFKPSVRFAKKSLLAAQQIIHSTDLSPTSLKAMQKFQQRTFGEYVLQTSYPRLVFSAIVAKLRRWFVPEPKEAAPGFQERSSYYRELLSTIPDESSLSERQFNEILKQQPELKEELVQAARRTIELPYSQDRAPALDFLRHEDANYIRYLQETLRVRGKKRGKKSGQGRNGSGLPNDLANHILGFEVTELYPDLLQSEYKSTVLPQSWMDYLQAHAHEIPSDELIPTYGTIEALDSELDQKLMTEILHRGTKRQLLHLAMTIEDPALNRQILAHAASSEMAAEIAKSYRKIAGTLPELQPFIRSGVVPAAEIHTLLRLEPVDRGFLEAVFDSPVFNPEMQRTWIGRVTAETVQGHLPLEEGQELLRRIPTAAKENYVVAQKALRSLQTTDVSSRIPGKSGIVNLVIEAGGEKKRTLELHFDARSVEVDGVRFTKGKSALDDRIVALFQEPRKNWERPDLEKFLKSLRGPQFTDYSFSNELGIWREILSLAYDHPWTHQEWLALASRHPSILGRDAYLHFLLNWGLRHVDATKMRPDVLREIERLAIRHKVLSPKERTYFLQNRPLGKLIQGWANAANPSVYLHAQKTPIVVTESDLKILAWISAHSPVETGPLPRLVIQDDIYHLYTLLKNERGNSPGLYVDDGALFADGKDKQRIDRIIPYNVLSAKKAKGSNPCKGALLESLKDGED